MCLLLLKKRERKKERERDTTQRAFVSHVALRSTMLCVLLLGACKNNLFNRERERGRLNHQLLLSCNNRRDELHNSFLLTRATIDDSMDSFSTAMATAVAAASIIIAIAQCHRIVQQQHSAVQYNTIMGIES